MTAILTGPPPLTEPIAIPDVFATGVAVESSIHVVRIVGWTELPNLAGEAEERRIMLRFVLPVDAARRLHEALGSHLEGT